MSQICIREKITHFDKVTDVSSMRKNYQLGLTKERGGGREKVITIKTHPFYKVFFHTAITHSQHLQSAHMVSTYGQHIQSVGIDVTCEHLTTGSMSRAILIW